jgi:uncharacterized membrane protein YjfL (UPF0719 family)
MDNQMKEYRQHLVLAGKDAQQDFDKTVFAFSGGAIGISFAFVTDIVKPDAMLAPSQLILAWGSWTVSLVCVLLSYYFSTLALRKAVKQIDQGKLSKEHAGGFYDTATAWLNPAGALFFILGLIFMICFVKLNLGV